MPVDTDQLPDHSTPTSEIDRLAILVTAHLLAAGIWLERRLWRTPVIRRGVVGNPVSSVQVTRVVRSGALSIHHSRNEDS
jgi:hypothetical protein